MRVQKRSLKLFCYKLEVTIERNIGAFLYISLVRISEEEKKAAAEKRQFNSLCQLYREIGNGLAFNEVEAVLFN